MKTTIVIILCVLLGGCFGMGVQQMTPEQIKATNGMATCTQIFSMYGKGISTAVNVDDVRKGATQDSEIMIDGDCKITIKNKVGVPAK